MLEWVLFAGMLWGTAYVMYQQWVVRPRREADRRDAVSRYHVEWDEEAERVEVRPNGPGERVRTKQEDSA